MGKISIGNIRLKLATNSSSSHSFIIMQKPFDDSGYSRSPDGWFGWDNFELKSREDKSLYLAVMLRDSLGESFSPPIANMIINALLGVVPSEESYIDHDSSFTFPKDYYYPGNVDLDFFADFRAWALSNQVIIRGGNDNKEYHWDMKGVDKVIDLRHYGYDDLVARRDPNLGWVLFNRSSGAKLRIKFDSHDIDINNLYPGERGKSQLPELVDIKITDYCDFGCKFCYQASTPKGKHCDLYDYKRIIDFLSKAKVFEIAIGGGEPTSHPDFVEMLKYAREKGIVPNFTTRNMKWLEDQDLAKEIMAYAGNFAFSLSEFYYASELKRLNALAIVNHIEDRINFHVVMGTLSKASFKQLMKLIRSYDAWVTLLGYKSVGRGTNFNKQDYSWFPDAMKELYKDKELPFVSVDTVLAEEFERELVDMGVSRLSFFTQDGLTSAYIDAVNKYMARSSYDTNGKIDLPDYLYDLGADWLLANFSKF